MAVDPSLERFLAAFGESPGVLPDGQIVKSSRADWTAVLSVLSKIGTVPRWIDDGQPVAVVQLNDSTNDGRTFWFEPVPGLRINFFAGPEVLFDIDLRDITSERALRATHHVLGSLGRATGKRVTLSREGALDDVVVTYAPDTHALTWETPPDGARPRLPDGVTTADVIADVRGHDRDY